MDYNKEKIAELLEKYWAAETSVEEESTLRDFFLHSDIPAEWKVYAPVFQYQNTAQQQQLSPDFNQRLLRHLRQRPQKPARVHILPKWIMRAAAAILLLLGMYFLLPTAPTAKYRL